MYSSSKICLLVWEETIQILWWGAGIIADPLPQNREKNLE
jgi:hypothetical protein